MRELIGEQFSQMRGGFYRDIDKKPFLIALFPNRRNLNKHHHTLV